MFQGRVWGDVPAGFKRFSPNRKQMVLVREGLEGCLDPEKFFARPGKEEASPFLGRARLGFFRLPDGEAVVVRSYWHGGLFRRFTGDLFFAWPPRPFRELAVTAEINRRGIPTLEMLAAWVERSWGPFYRGWLVTRELKGARDLWAALQGGFCAEKDARPLLHAVAVSLRRMHLRGVYHRDLNLKNIMVRREGDQIKSYIIDFDKAKLFSGEVPAMEAQKNLRRLLRSICKLDPDRRLFSQANWEFFVRFYREAGAG